MTTVIAAPPPTAGIHVLQQLNIVENYDLAKMGYHSADALHVLIEATKLAGADRRGMGGDPDFVDMPMTGLLSKPYAAKRKALIDMNKAMAVWSKYSNAQRVSSLHLSKGCLNLASRSDTYSFRVRSSLPASSPRSRFEPAVRTPGGPVARHPQLRGRKTALRREIPSTLRGFQGPLSC